MSRIIEHAFEEPGTVTLRKSLATSLASERRAR
jgi:hypothetical protein